MPHLRFCILSAALLVCSGCRLNGDIHAFRVNDRNRLVGPWHETEKLTVDKLVHRKLDEPREDRADTYTVYFDHAFFKYLPDLGTSNEVVVVFTFREGPEDSELVKIWGPMTGIGDSSFASNFGRITYGPKFMEGDSLSVKIEIYEYDAAESEATSSFLSFVGDVVQTFTLGNPLTSTEIELAKSVATTLANSNKNDLVLTVAFDLLPFEPKQATNGTDSKKTATAESFYTGTPAGMAIPLVAGNWGVIQQEKGTELGVLFFYTQSLEFEDHWFQDLMTWPLEFIADLVLLPFATTNRVFFDAPDRASLRQINTKNSELVDGDTALGFDPATHRLVSGSASRRGDLSKARPYESKTWITFTVERGRDPSLWEARAKLAATEKEINRFMRSESSADNASEFFAALSEQLQEYSDELNKEEDESEDDPGTPDGTPGSDDEPESADPTEPSESEESDEIDQPNSEEPR